MIEALPLATCGTREANCVCGEPAGHESPHECEDKLCNGSWGFDREGNFKIYRYPDVKREGRTLTEPPLADLLEMMWE